MDKSAVLKIIGQFKDVLEKKGIKIERLILYGSYATGTQREGSDIDLVVISNDFLGLGYWQRIDLLSAAIYEVFQPIEAVAMTRAEWEKGDSFIVDFARNGEVVFAA
ncbi:MAG: nucleotidyltransferase domain-containing protein [Acidobacteria bacterium]|nr:nucleotidyltransferase domain-containing protein [Acidobacteriota bacterium]MBU4307538.1 nucleotidyltransferase domain-containing protein [Acidobacteriota bacterium]MBU4405007.1 nucleotidyltransferase domain-containing protein [Acidobacteriota bacterium]MCG2810921.1 nucleotidyltransferase domain-containing protein [Candidatus Aminicenantes bacterium]